MVTDAFRKGQVMARKRHTPEQITRKLREAEVALSRGEATGDAAATYRASFRQPGSSNLEGGAQPEADRI